MITRWGAVVRRLPTEDWLVIGWVFATEIILLIFGVRSFHMIEDKRVPAHLGWLEIWNRWDALHFQRIAEAGYSASDKLKAWFYPLYPWCVRWTAYLTGNSLVAAFVVSGISFISRLNDCRCSRLYAAADSYEGRKGRSRTALIPATNQPMFLLFQKMLNYPLVCRGGLEPPSVV